MVNTGGSHALAMPGWVSDLSGGDDGISISGLTLVVDWKGSSWWGWDWLSGDWSVLGGFGGGGNFVGEDNHVFGFFS